MRTLITPQQISFFVQNGYIEFEGVGFDPLKVFASIRSVANIRAKHQTLHLSSIEKYQLGRDLWREEQSLQTLLLKTLGPIALSLVAKPLRLAGDQWIPADYTWNNSCPIKELFSIQGLALGVIFCDKEVLFPLPPPLGLVPLPKNPQNVLFVKPDLLIHWQTLATAPSADLYLAVYAHQSAVYVRNPNDLAGNHLKQLGCHFGDTLRNPLHPLLQPRTR